MSNTFLYCLDPFSVNCTWTGDDSELVSTDDDPDSFTHCPNCDGDEFDEEDEEDYDEDDDEDL